MKYTQNHLGVSKSGLSLFSALTVLMLSIQLNAGYDPNYLTIQNTPKCASDMSKPADSLFLAASLRNTGIILNNLAKQTDKNPSQFVGEGLKFYKIKLITLTQLVLQGMNSGQLPNVRTNEEAVVQLSKWNKNTSSKSYFSQMKCYQVNEINTYYSHLFLRGVNQDTLNQLAQKFSEAQSPLTCEPQQIKNDLDLYPVFNFDLKIVDSKLWDQVGFDFWASFKIYLSAAWRSNIAPEISQNPMNRYTLLAPLEEQLLILSNGCKNIERPQCNSDFLSSAELRNLFTTDRSKLELTSSSLEMKDLIFDNNDQTDTSIKQNLAQKSGDQSWIKDFQKAYMGFSTKQIDNLYFANKLFSSALTQKNFSQLAHDLVTEIKNPNNLEEAHYLCMEHRLLMHEQPLNVYQFDLANLKANSSKLDQYLKYGMTVTDIYASFEKMSTQITQACNQLDSQQIKESENKWNNYRPWYKNFLSRYQLIKAAMEVEKQENSPETFIDSRPKTYLKDLCVNAIDCHRSFTESITQVNKLLIHSRTFLRTDIQSSPVFAERAEKVACGMYDPFEASRLNKKKLIADLASSVLFGWTSLPIYLDVNFKPKELVSFNKLMENGHIRFDTEFDKNQITKTISLSLGSFINVPCAINISEVGDDISNAASNYIYKGLSVSACKGQRTESMSSPTGSIDVFKKSPDSDYQVCGQCSLNFEKVSTLNVVNTFAPLRFILRLTQSLMRYQNVKNDDTINPREFNISMKSLLETYKKNNNNIPNSCVPYLARGLSCQSNMCEALAVKEFEIKSGLEVDQIQLTKNMDTGTDQYDAAWVKVKGCKKELRMTFRCSGQGDSFWMPVSQREYKQCLE